MKSEFIDNKVCAVTLLMRAGKRVIVFVLELHLNKINSHFDKNHRTHNDPEEECSTFYLDDNYYNISVCFDHNFYSDILSIKTCPFVCGKYKNFLLLIQSSNNELKCFRLSLNVKKQTQEDSLICETDIDP